MYYVVCYIIWKLSLMISDAPYLCLISSDATLIEIDSLVFMNTPAISASTAKETTSLMIFVVVWMAPLFNLI